MNTRQIIPLIAVLVTVALIALMVNFYSGQNSLPTPEPSISNTEQEASSQKQEASSTSIFQQSQASSSQPLAPSFKPAGRQGNLQAPNLESVQITAPDGIIIALIATSSADQDQGLSDRDSLPSNQGMIFIFPEQGSYGFWMKDMRFPLDMVWIGANKVVAGVTSDISPDTYPNLFLPPSPILYVLELNAGQAKRFGIIMGTKLNF